MTTYKNLSTGVIISEVIYNKLPYNKRHKYSRTYRPEPISSYTLIIEDIDDTDDIKELLEFYLHEDEMISVPLRRAITYQAKKLNILLWKN